MTSGQRKAHKYSWLVLAIIITTLLFFTVSELSFSKTNKRVEDQKVVLKRDGNEVRVLLNTPFKSSSAVVYGLTTDGKRGALLGQIDGMGSYSFQSEHEIKGILIIDEIKGQEVYKSEF